MDVIYIYKKDYSLKEKFSHVRLNYSRNYKMGFPTSFQQLRSQLLKERKGLLLYFTDVLNQEDRIIIKNILQTLPDVHICLCTNKSFALDAWKLNVQNFLDHPIDSEKIKSAFKRYLYSTSNIHSTVDIKTDEGLIQLDLAELLYIKAAGNYCALKFIDNRNFFITKQIHHFEKWCEKDLYIQRVNRSLIINLKKIKKVGNKEISFYTSDSVLEVSKSLENKVKKILLGKS